MKNFWGILFVGGFLLATFLCPAAGAANPIPQGEVLRYQVKWNIFTGAYLTFERKEDMVVGGERAFHIHGETESVGFLGRFHPYWAKADTFFSRSSFRPLGSRFESGNRGELLKEKVSYCHEKKTGFWYQEKSKEDNPDQVRVKEEEFPVPDFFQDPLSMIYFLRTQDLKVGKTIKVPMVVDRKEYLAEVEVREKRRIRVLGGVREAFILVPGVSLRGVPYRHGSMWIWISADKDRLPLHFSARAPLGLFTATLVEVER